MTDSYWKKIDAQSHSALLCLRSMDDDDPMDIGAEFVGYQLDAKFDGCIHLTRKYADNIEEDYIHICDGADFIRQLEAALVLIRTHFEDHAEYWK